MMSEYDNILKQIEELPDVFGKVDIVDLARAELNLSARKQPSGDDHLVICISRTQGSAGNDIGFELADDLHINYYDVEIFNQVLTRLEAEKGSVTDAETESFAGFDKYRKRSFRLNTWFREFNRYHGLPRQDAVFFNMSDLICNLARTEDCVIMGRCLARSVRGKSKPTELAGPPMEYPETSTISSHIGALPGHSTSASSGTTIVATISSTRVERRSGWRWVSAPISGPPTIATTTSTVITAEAAGRLSPSPAVRYG